MLESNKILKWAMTALLNNDFSIPDDEQFRKALQLSGIPKSEIETNILKVGQSPLKSIFSEVNLSGNDQHNESGKWIKWLKLDPGDFPQLLERKPVDSGISALSDMLKNDPLFSDEITNSNVALALLEKYGTYLSVSPNQPYLCFFDCIKNAAALYECTQTKATEKFLLIGGDLSGIQRYLFDLSENSSKNVAKILRAKSFYLGLFTEVCRHYILHSLNLPLLCTLMDAGGRFILIVKDTQETRKKLKEIQKEIDQFCITEFNGELFLNLSYDVSLNENDFDSKALIQKIEELNSSLENIKSRPFSKILKNEKWKPEEFVLSHNYIETDDNVCIASGKLPKDENRDDDFSTQYGRFVDIGKNLVKDSVLGFKKGKTDAKKSIDNYIIGFQFGENCYEVHLRSTIPADQRNIYYLIEDLSGSIDSDIIPRYMANHVPRYETNPVKNKRVFPFNDDKLKEFSLELSKDPEDARPKKGDIIDFGALACAGAENIADEGEEPNFVGSKYIGVIKADVDGMGQIFANGIGHIFSISAYSTLSRQLNLFFTAYLPAMQQKKFKYIYTVYAGGDDLFFIGEWQQAIEFSHELYSYFKLFTGELTLSSAVYIMHEHHPIRTAAENAEAMLEKAKANKRDSLNDRDSVAVFDIVFKQEKFKELMDIANYLNKRRRKPDVESNINSAFLHRMIKYRHLAMKWLTEHKISGLIFIPRLSYDIRRNFTEYYKRHKQEDEKINNLRNEEINKLTFYTNSLHLKEWYLLQLPTFWTILKNRQIKM